MVHLKWTDLDPLIQPGGLASIGSAIRGTDLRTLIVYERLAPYRHTTNQNCGILIVPAVDLDEVQRHRELIVRICSQVKCFLEPCTLAQHIVTTQYLRHGVAPCSQQRIDIGCPLLDAVLEVVVDAPLAQHVRICAGKARLHRDHANVINGKALVMSGLIQRRRHTEHC